MKRRGLVVAAVALVVLLAGGVAGVSWKSADQLVHPARDAAGAAPQIHYERVVFDSADGLALVGWWIPSEGADAVVIFLHGYGDSKDQALPLLPFLHAAGYHVLAFDMRAHGESEGSETTVGLDEVQDVRGALSFVGSRDPAAADRIALLGFSMGAATAINAAAVDPRIDAVVADSAFATLENIASNSITAFTGLPKYPFGPLSVVFAGWMVGQDVSENAPVRAVAQASAPVLVIQGLADTIAFPDADGRAIAEAAPADSELWLVPGAAHVQAHHVAGAEYEARVVAFLDQRLS